MRLKIFLSLILSSCASQPINDIQPKVFMTDHINQRIYRLPAESISCKQPEFESYTCMSNTDFQDLVTEIIYRRAKVYDGE